MYTIITHNIFDYIRVSLKLFLPSRIYRLPLNWPNFKYIMYPIWKSGFWDLAFLVPKDGPIGLISKTIVFVNKIKNIIRLERYLQSRLPYYVHNRKQAFVIIMQLIISNLDANTKTRAMENFQYENTQTCICTEYAGININILNIIYMI